MKIRRRLEDFHGRRMVERDLDLHPKAGALWEGYAIEELLKSLRPDESYFWATYQGGRRIGNECKRMDAPSLTAPMRIAVRDLQLDRLLVA